MGNADQQFKTYAELIKKWNAKYNLTAIDDDEGIQTRHFDDSLAAVPFVEHATKLIDLGTGAGLPGIPLKIALPQMSVTLIDAKRKKIAFCQEVIRALALEGITAIDGRAEDQYIYRGLGTFDIVISRATWSLDVFLSIAMPYMGARSSCIAMRGAHWEGDLEEARETIKRYDLKLQEKHEYMIGESERRCLLIFSK